MRDRGAGLVDWNEAWQAARARTNGGAAARLTRQLVAGEDGWRLAEPGTVKWAVISWEAGALR